MNNPIKTLIRFFTGEFFTLIVVLAIGNIKTTLSPVTGGHSFEQGGMEGFIFGATLAFIITLIHTFIFLVPFSLSMRFGSGVLNIKPLLTSICGIVSGISLFVTPKSGGIPAVIFIPTFSFCALVIALELYAKKSGINRS